MNIQFAVKEGRIYVLEVNPRASRTVPFVSKAIGVPLAKLAARVMAGKSLAELGFTKEVTINHIAVKEAVFPFAKFPGVDTLLGPEMKSTGEVMGIDTDFGMSFAKSQMAAGNPMPVSGRVFLSVKDKDKAGVLEVAQGLQKEGFAIVATRGTAEYLTKPRDHRRDREQGDRGKAAYRGPDHGYAGGLRHQHCLRRPVPEGFLFHQAHYPDERDPLFHHHFRGQSSRAGHSGNQEKSLAGKIHTGVSPIMTQKIPMTQGGYDKLKQELDHIIKVERPKNIKDIEEARAHGDLSENAEYHAAKERQGHLDAKKRELRAQALSCPDHRCVEAFERKSLLRLYRYAF